MKQVGAVGVRVLLDGATRLGVPVERLLHGLDPEGDVLQGRRKRYPWPLYATMLERLAVEVGGYEQLAEASEIMPDVFPEAQTLFRAFVSPVALYTFVMLVVDPVVYPMFAISCERMGDSRLRVSFRLEPSYDGCTAWGWATLGALRAVPKYIGLPPARAEALALTPHEGVYVVEPPVSGTLLAKARRALPRATRDFLDELGLEGPAQTADESDLAAAHGDLEAQLSVFASGEDRTSRAAEVERRLEAAAHRWKLSPRQKDVLRELVSGRTNGEIAEALGCTPRTVETHITALLGRADATSRLSVVASFWSEL